MDLSDEVKQVIASNTTNKMIVDVIKFVNPAFDSFYVTSMLEDGATITNEDDESVEVLFCPCELSIEDEDGLLLNERDLTIQGINDLIANYEDLVDTYNQDNGLLPKQNRIVVQILGYIGDSSGNLSSVEMGPYTYYVMSTSYSQEYNACKITIATSPTNQSKTGRTFNKLIFPMLEGFDT